MQDKNDHTQYVTFTTTGGPVDNTTYVEFPVVHQAHGSSLGGGQLVIVQNTGGNLPGGGSISQLTGDVTAGPGTGSQVATIAADAVTYAKLQNVSAASRLLGRGSASGSGDPEEIVLGTNLSMSGTTLNASGGGGGAHATTHDTGGSDPITALAGSVITTGTIASARLPARIGAVGIVIDGGGSVITTGVKGFVQVPFACTITGWTLLSTDASATAGSIVIDVWKDTLRELSADRGRYDHGEREAHASSAQQEQLHDPHRLDDRDRGGRHPRLQGRQRGDGDARRLDPHGAGDLMALIRVKSATP